MDDIKGSFTYIFKEKNAIAKLAILLVTWIIFVVAMFIFLIGINGLESQFLIGSDISLNNGPLAGILGILFICIGFVICIVFTIITLWYQYEHMQAAIENRETKGIWEYSLMDTIKKSGKLMLQYIALNLPVFLIAFVILVAFFCFASTFILNTFSSNLRFSEGSLDNMFGGLMLFYCIFFCIYLIGIIFISIYQYLFVLPSQLRMISTNTFAEGLDIRHNWYIGKKYWSRFASVLGVNFLGGVIIGVIYYCGIYLGMAGMIASPVVGITLIIIIYALYMIGVLYLSQIVIPNYSGRVYRKVLELEGSNS